VSAGWRLVLSFVLGVATWSAVAAVLTLVGTYAIHVVATRDASTLKVDLLLDCALLSQEEDQRCE
jgi:uncharacterized membrane protein (Fun14 family)